MRMSADVQTTADQSPRVRRPPHSERPDGRQGLMVIVLATAYNDT